MIFNVLIIIIGFISLTLGLLSGINYLSHPWANTKLISYTGGKFWLTFLICLLVFCYRIS